MSHAPVSKFSSSDADLVYAVNESRRIVHVSEVSSGAACGCHCPSCDGVVIARKGRERTHHFAHKLETSCRSAPETALHKLAKEIIQEQRELLLPAVVAQYEDKRREIHREQKVVFTGAQSESRHLRGVVPDLFVTRGNRSLLVEIYVTHPCDENKRDELREKGIATLEIDLSTFPRDATRQQVLSAVISEADRHWVYHPKIESEVSAMRAASEAAQQRKKDIFDRKVSNAESVYKSALQKLAALKQPRLNSNSEVFRAGYGEHVGIQIDGAGCFTVTLAEWQFFLLRDAFSPRPENPYPTYRVKDLLDWFKKRKLIRSEFNYVAPEIEEALRKRNIGFLSPYRSVEAYLYELVDRGVLYKQQGAYIATDFVEAINTLRATDSRREQHRKSLEARGDAILQILPIEERLGLTGASWLKIPQANGISLADVLNNDDLSIDQFFFKLRSLEEMFFRKGQIVDDDLKLPIADERKRLRHQRQQEAEAREAAAEKARREAEAVRIARLKSEADKYLSATSDAWLRTTNVDLDKLLPIEVAAGSDNDLMRALAALTREVQKRRNELERVQMMESSREILRSAVTKSLGPAAQPFLVSPYVELGHKRPIDYCVDKKTLQACLALAEKVRRLRA